MKTTNYEIYDQTDKTLGYVQAENKARALAIFIEKEILGVMQGWVEVRSSQIEGRTFTHHNSKEYMSIFAKEC